MTVNPKPPLTSTSLNWDAQPSGFTQRNAPILSPRDVVQVAFLLAQSSEEQENLTDAGEDDGRTTIGQLAIQWRSALGDRGSLSTGWLTARS